MPLMATTTPPGPQRLTGKLSVIIALLGISVFINYVDRGNLSIAAPMLKEELGISASQLGVLLSAFFWTYACLQPVSGWLVDRVNVNWVIAGGFFLWSAATAATGILHTFAMLFGLRLVLGMGESVACPRPVSGARASTSSRWDRLRSVITSESVITSLAGFGARRPHPLGGRTAIPAVFRYALAVSRRILVACWIRRSDHPSRPRAKTCCFFSSFKTLANAHGAYKPPRESMSRTPLSLAGFQVILIGRFWVIAEVQRFTGSQGLIRGLAESQLDGVLVRLAGAGPQTGLRRCSLPPSCLRGQSVHFVSLG